MECRAYGICLDSQSRGYLGKDRKVSSAAGGNLSRMHKTQETAKESRLNFMYSHLRNRTLEGYFDSIPHDKLMACVRMRVVDGSVLKLIRQWLKAPVVEEDQAGRKKIGRNRSGTPQGGLLSPLLANIYLHWFDRVFQSKSGPAHWAKATLIRYADDFVVMARHLSPRIRDFIEQKLEAWLGLKLNRQKTRIVNLRRNQERLEFLGYQIGLAPGAGGSKPPLLAYGAQPQGNGT